MTNERIERTMIWTAVLLIALAAVLLGLTGCATGKTKVVYERVEVPKPYREYPENIRPLPEEPDYQTDHITAEAAEADPTAALVLVGQDFGLCQGSNALLRALYLELVRRVSAPQTPPPDPPSSDPD